MMMREDQYRMRYHLMPPEGWLNDPNGLCQFRGEYHVFFQYTPDSPLGGQKYWGHYISRDWMHWQFAGPALAPDQPFDRDGVYSGSAIVVRKPEGDQMQIYYTGNVKQNGEHDYIDSGREANVIYTDSADGRHFSEKRLLLTNADYPEDYTCHVRDPKVFLEQGKYYMALGGRKRGVAAGPDGQREDQGTAMLYCSEDGIHWKLEQEFETERPFGYMWECPDLFPMGSKTCFSFCPQGLEKEEYRYQNTDQSGYVWLEELKSGQVAGRFTEWDMGFEFYAPQTFEDEKERRILIGWVGLPTVPYGNPTVETGWQHCLTIPRNLTVQNGVICQNPLEELQDLREDEQTWTGDGCTKTEDFSFWLTTERMDTDNWSLSFGGNMFFRYENQVFSWQFPDGDAGENDWGRGRRIRKMHLEKLTDIQVLCDRSVVEIFINGGSRAMCGRFYPQAGSCEIREQGCGAGAVTRFWHMRAVEVK